MSELNHNKVNIGTIQMRCGSSKQENLAKAVDQIKIAASQGAQIICLQELFTSLYFCDTEDHKNFSLAEAIPGGESLAALQPLAKKHGVVIIASLFEKRTEGLYHNTIAVIDADGSYLGKYRKSHIPDDPGYYEKFYFTPGDTGYKVFNTRYGKVGTLICWDQWYPEAARITSLMGAEILFYPTAIGYSLSEPKAEGIEQREAWITIQRSHSIANGVPVVAVNRVGQEGDAQFWGSTFITNAFGSVLYQASQEKEEVAVTTVDLKESNRYRTTWPFLRDRRIDTYQPITKRFLDGDPE